MHIEQHSTRDLLFTFLAELLGVALGVAFLADDLGVAFLADTFGVAWIKHGSNLGCFRGLIGHTIQCRLRV